jgi:hypothetical protein
VIHYSEFGNRRQVLFLLCVFNLKGEPIELCGGSKVTCLFARNFSMQFMTWLAKDSFAVKTLQFGNNHTGMQLVS